MDWAATTEPARLPFLPLSGEQKTEIEKLMAGSKANQGLS